MSSKETIRDGKRRWKARLLELLAWLLVAIVTAIILVILTDRLAPPNF
jgi:hypothetical protein